MDGWMDEFLFSNHFPSTIPKLYSKIKFIKGRQTSLILHGPQQGWSFIPNLFRAATVRKEAKRMPSMSKSRGRNLTFKTCKILESDSDLSFSLTEIKLK